MTDLAQASVDWTKPETWTKSEQWVWERIAAGEPADLNARDREHDPDFKDLDPRKEEGWADNRRLRVKFLQTILTQKAFADATPDGGVRVLGALVDDAPLDLEHARLQHTFWLERSRILTDVKCRSLRVDGEMSLESSFVAGGVELPMADIRESLRIASSTFEKEVSLNSAKVDGAALLHGATFKGEVDLAGTSVGSVLYMIGSTFEKKVSLNAAKVAGGAFLRGGATFKGEVNLASASIGSVLDMTGSTFEEKVSLSAAKVDGAALLHGATFKGEVNLTSASVGSSLEMHRATFKGEVDLMGASVGSVLDMTGSTFEENVRLGAAKVDYGALLRGASFKGEVDLMGARIGFLTMDSSTFEKEVSLSYAKVHGVGLGLDMTGATFEEKVSLNSAEVDGAALLHGATFKGEVDLAGTSVGSVLDMIGSTFEKKVSLNAAKVAGGAFLRGATFKGEVYLKSASVGLGLDMEGSTFEENLSLSAAKVDGGALLRGASFKGEVDLMGASVGSVLDMTGSTFEENLSLSAAKVDDAALLRGGATFKGEVNLAGASIGSSLDVSGANFGRRVDLTQCQVKGELRLGSSRHPPARWEEAALLVLRNTHVAAFQDWWRDSSDNSWPKVLELQGFSYDRLGGFYGQGKEADMMARPSACYVEWLGKDPSISPQPYEQLASLFRRAGEPVKANDILYEARERRRRLALSKVDDQGHRKDRDLLGGLGLWMLRLTIGYGLGNRYFRVLWWVLGLTFLGTFLLITVGRHSPANWVSLTFASLDQLLPFVTLDNANDALIFGDSSAHPPVDPQPYGVVAYFYLHKIIGWVLASFIVAGLAGLTQRN